MNTYTVERVEGGWQIVRHTKAHNLVSVAALVGGLCYRRDDGTLEEVPKATEFDLYTFTSAPLLGVFKRKRDAEAWMKGLV
jgi:hypothetical protein